MSAETTTAIIPAKADQQTVIPGSVTDQDIDRVYADFLKWTQWDNPNKRTAFRTKAEKRLAKIACRIQALQDQAEELRKSLSFEEKKQEARTFLNTAAQRFGTMGSPSVLMMVLKQRYPKRIKRANPAAESSPSSRTQTKPISTPPKAVEPIAPKVEPAAPPAEVASPKAEPVAPKAQPAAPKADKAADQPVRPNAQRQKVFDALDKEGMTLKEIKDACRLPADVVKVALANLITDQLVTVDGKGSTKSYRRATESS